MDQNYSNRFLRILAFKVIKESMLLFAVGHIICTAEVRYRCKKEILGMGFEMPVIFFYEPQINYVFFFYSYFAVIIFMSGVLHKTSLRRKFFNQEKKLTIKVYLEIKPVMSESSEGHFYCTG